MNILLWILQVLLAFHTAMGVAWKFSNPPSAVESLSAIPQPAWLALCLFELVCVVLLLLPAIRKGFGRFVPLAAIGIAAVMALYMVMHVSSGLGDNSQLVYWGVVAAFCAFIAIGRMKLRPLP